MAKKLRVIIERMVEINDETFEIIAPLFIRKKLKQHLLVEGTVCEELIFIIKGCTRIYTIHQGKEKDVWFGFPLGVGSDIQSFISDKPTQFYIQALMDLEYLSIPKEVYHLLLKTVPLWGTFMRKMWEEAIVHFVNRTLGYQNFSAEIDINNSFKSRIFYNLFPKNIGLLTLELHPPH
jgi:CRP/FNR family transcriptional regulator, anaerobic regulatory protein